MMSEKTSSLRKQYGIWIVLLLKRLWRQPVYLGLLVLIPLLGYGIGVLEQGERGGAVVAVCVEEGTWSEEIAASLTEQEKNSVLRFLFCEDGRQVERHVIREEADCGFVLPSDLKEKTEDGDWRKCITVYETDTSSITGMAKERIAGVVFRLYAEARYEEYMAQFSEPAADFAIEAYEEHLADDSTFGFRYLFDDSNSQFQSDTDVVNDESVRAAVFPVKGIFAVLILIAGMCGMLEYEKDKKEKKFLRLAPDALTYIVDVGISTVMPAAAVLLCLWLSDGMRACGGSLSMGPILSVWDAGMWGRQILSLIAYQGMIAGYCVLLRLILRRQETIAAAIPILAMGSLLCAPVFIRLGTYMPVFAVLEKLFPVSYYLMLS